MTIKHWVGECLTAVLMLPFLSAAVLAADAGGEAQARVAQAAALPTPKTAAGTPDLSGYWTVVGGFVNPTAVPGTSVTKDGKTVRPIAGPEIDEQNGNKASVARRLADTAARPTYKPEYQAKARANWDRANYLDPSFGCQPQGVPRIGPPTEIVQTANTLYFLYQTHNAYRVIYMDGRKHDPDAEPMPMGESIAHWDGDTLVVDATSFPDTETWLNGDGSFHSADMHVVERFTRKGNSLTYALTVEDPIFAEPFNARPRTLLMGAADQHAGEDYPCTEHDLVHMQTKERH